MPDRGEVADNITFIVNLTVTDKSGQSITISRNINPLKSTFTLATNPVGLSVTLDGTPQEPRAINVSGVQGIIRELGAPSGQVLKVNGVPVTYKFVSWSDGGAQTHEIASPTANTTYTATFQPTNAVANTAPVAKILTPAAGTTYAAGTTLSFSGDGTDKEDGALPASAYAWKIELYHADDMDVHSTATFPGVKSGIVRHSDHGNGGQRFLPRYATRHRQGRPGQPRRHGRCAAADLDYQPGQQPGRPPADARRHGADRAADQRERHRARARHALAPGPERGEL
ncbi:MAG: hypothetical protein WKG07_37235 [Hymenobacter sp.]